MRVLITNNTFDAHAGSELYARDVALALLRRGHQPVAYSTHLGAVARELREATVPVIDDLAQLAVAPDIIHAQHHLDAMTAMLRFPQVPAVYFCHGWVPWEEMPPKFPSLRTYVAVDDLCAERLHSESGIAPAQIRLIRNFVDLTRVEMRADLPARPRRALVFSNYAREDGYLGIVRKACVLRNIEVEAIGIHSGRVETNPASLLHNYDIVFAKARSAIEAMASGAAVIVCDAAGLAGIVTDDNYAAGRALNFGVRTLSRAITVEAILAELDAYDAAQARRVGLRIRDEADMERAVDAIVETYAQAIAAHRAVPVDAHSQLIAASDYLRGIAAVAKVRHAALRAREVAAAEMRHQHLRAEQAEGREHALSARLEEMNAARRAESAVGDELQRENRQLQEQVVQLEHDIGRARLAAQAQQTRAEALLASWSWRITAPLRWGARLFARKN